MRADNQGEGGILALMALVPAQLPRRRSSRGVLVGARALRRRPALRRRHDHAGHLGARRDRGPHGRDPALRPLRRAAHGRRPRRPLPRSSAAARRASARCSGRSWWSGSSRSPSLGVALDRAATRAVLAAVNPLLRRSTSSRRNGCHGVPRARLGVPRRHRRRGALRRHGALRQAADPPRVVRARAAGAAAELLRPGRAAAAATRSAAEQPVLPARARRGCCCPLVGARHAARRSSPRRRSSRRRSRSRPGRPCSSATARAWTSSYTSAETMGQIYVPQVNWALMLATIALVARLPVVEQRWRRPTASRSR